MAATTSDTSGGEATNGAATWGGFRFFSDPDGNGWSVQEPYPLDVNVFGQMPFRNVRSPRALEAAGAELRERLRRRARRRGGRRGARGAVALVEPLAPRFGLDGALEVAVGAVHVEPHLAAAEAQVSRARFERVLGFPPVRGLDRLEGVDVPAALELADHQIPRRRACLGNFLLVPEHQAGDGDDRDRADDHQELAVRDDEVAGPGQQPVRRLELTRGRRRPRGGVRGAAAVRAEAVVGPQLDVAVGTALEDGHAGPTALSNSSAGRANRWPPARRSSTCIAPSRPAPRGAANSAHTLLKIANGLRKKSASRPHQPSTSVIPRCLKNWRRRQPEQKYPVVHPTRSTMNMPITCR